MNETNPRRAPAQVDHERDQGERVPIDWPSWDLDAARRGRNVAASSTPPFDRVDSIELDCYLASSYARDTTLHES